MDRSLRHRQLAGIVAMAPANEAPKICNRLAAPTLHNVKQAQDEFEVMISTDSNIEYQQQLPSYDIALIVLRSVTGQVDELATLMPDCEDALQNIQSGECFYLFTDEAWVRELKRGKIRQRWLPQN